MNINKTQFCNFCRKKYFSQLTKAAVRSLYHKYRVDHELFGYGVEPYLSLAREKEEVEEEEEP